MALDGHALGRGLGIDAPVVYTQLCRQQIDAVKAAAAAGVPLLIGCTQEQPVFDEVLTEVAAGTDVAYANIRERAGWSAEGDQALPKVAALLAEAALDREPTPALTLTSRGTTLVYGDGPGAVAAAQRLAGRLSVTLLLRDAGDAIPPGLTDFGVFRGVVRAAKGHLGAFEVTVDAYGAAAPSARSRFRFDGSADGVAIRCDLILDLSGDRPLFAAPSLRDGYLRVEPSDQLAIQRALFDLVDLVGEFEKPRFIRFNAAICAHSRNGVVGCNRCLEVCPTQAIVPAGDHVAIDPYVCAGHGACVSVCPTGAVAFDLPRGNLIFERLRMLLKTYRQCGGVDPVLLMHDARFGEEAIALIARTGRGLPAHVIPFAVHEITQIGLDVLLTALAYGAAQVRIIAAAAQTDALAPLHRHQALIESVMTGLGYPGERVRLDPVADPHAFEKDLYDSTPPPAVGSPAGHIVLGGRQETLAAALRHLAAGAPQPVDVIALAAGAPFGRILLDEARCTLCLACVPVCPVGALGDHPEMPQLTFTESACVQCGLCRATCPERAISLEPRLSFTEAARTRVVLKTEAPFPCIRCGKPFASPATIARMLEAMAGHALYARDGALDLIKMCADCRVAAQFDDPATLFRKGQRPVPRTTDDYLRERELTQRSGSKDQSDG